MGGRGAWNEAYQNKDMAKKITDACLMGSDGPDPDPDARFSLTLPVPHVSTSRDPRLSLKRLNFGIDTDEVRTEDA